MRILLLILSVIIIPIPSLSQELKVLTDAISVRSFPDGKIIRTLDYGKTEHLLNRYSFWGRSVKGWINLDYTDYTFPEYRKMGKIKLRIAIVDAPCKAETDNGSVSLERGNTILVGREIRSRILGWYNGIPIAVERKNVHLENLVFNVVSLNRPLNLYSTDGRTATVLPGKTVSVTENGKVLYKGYLWSKSAFEKPTVKNINLRSLEKVINHLIDIFNAAKYSSPISERIGYYVKLLPINTNSFTALKTSDGIGLKIKLRYEFFYRNGEPVTGRKTRLILKKSNFDFWKTVFKQCFDSGINKFVEIDVYRFDGKSNFSKEGFIASSYHYYKDGKLSKLNDFIKNAESDFSNDLWFFADDVYERVEDGN